MKIYTIIGNRPQFMKIDKELKNQFLVHTGAHYDANMSRVFFEELDLPKPYINLNCDSSKSGVMFDKLLKLFQKDKPNLVIVYGDTTSTLMGALAAAYAKIPVAHIEAGMRSSDMKMPEEVNRVLVDRLATVRFCFTLTAFRNLNNEKQINHTFYVKGDPMFDAMNDFLPIKRTKDYRKYILLTIHRDFNADSRERLKSIFKAIEETNEKFIFPLHPRTKKNIEKFKLRVPKNVKVIEPVGYKKMLSLESNAKKIITDSGGVQREAYWMRIPCITLRKETEWVETVSDGWSVLVDADYEKLKEAIENFEGNATGQGLEMPVYGCNKKIREILSRYI